MTLNDLQRSLNLPALSTNIVNLPVYMVLVTSLVGNADTYALVMSNIEYVIKIIQNI